MFFGCGKNSNDALLDEYEKLCEKSLLIQAKMRGNDLSAMNDLQSLARQIQEVSGKLDSLKEKDLTGPQKERLLKIVVKCSGI